MGFLVIFQDGCEKDLALNQLTALTVYMIPINKEAKVLKISTKPKEEVDFEKGYYHGVYVLLKFNKEDGVTYTLARPF